MKRIIFIILINCSLISFAQKEKNQIINKIDSTEIELKADSIKRLVHIEKIIETKIEQGLKNISETKNGNFKYIKSKWIELLGLLIAILTFFIPIYGFLSQKREEQRDKRFITYHQLIADLVDPPGNKLDRQIATIFELRNFPNYFDLTKRIVTDLRTQWSQPPRDLNDPRNSRLLTELDLALKHIEKKSKWFNKVLYKVFGIK